MELIQENYFSKDAQKKYWGSSSFKDFMRCEAGALYKIENDAGEDKSKALLQGQYLDSFFEGTRGDFEKSHKVLKKNGERYAEFDIVEKAYKRIMDDEEMSRLCNGLQQQIFTGKICGVDFKIMIDSLLPDEAIVDRKLIKDFEGIWLNGEKVPFWKRWGYDIQAYLYQEIYRQNTGKTLPFRLAVVTKEAVPNIEVFEFSDETIARAKEVVESLIQRFDDVKAGLEEPTACGECEYCKSIKKIKEYVLI